MKIKRYVELDNMERISELYEEMDVEIQEHFEIISVNGNDAALFKINNSPILFYKLLFEDLIDDMVSIYEEDSCEIVYVKYLEVTYGNDIREAHKKELKDFSIKSALAIYTKSLYYRLNKDKIHQEPFINDFERYDEDTYIKTFETKKELVDYILSVENTNRIIMAPVNVLINDGDYILL